VTGGINIDLVPEALMKECLMLRISMAVAAIMLAGSAVTASAASKAPHRYHRLYMQAPTGNADYIRAPRASPSDDDYITDHAKGAVKDD
jgi:hypothetical protein